MFECFQRSFKAADSDSDSEPARPIPKVRVNPMPPRPRTRHIEEGPFLEEVMLARGLIKRQRESIK
jgi:hypothetical protein